MLKDTDIDEHLSILAADFSLKSLLDAPIYWMWQGFAYDKIIEELVKRTKEVRTKYPSSGVLWVSHFPPVSSRIEIREDLMLLGYDDVLRAAYSNNVNHILSGHIHRSVDCKHLMGGRVEVNCVGSACNYPGES